MLHLDRSKAVRGQAVVTLLAVLSFTMAGAGLGFWLGKYSGHLPFASTSLSEFAFLPAVSGISGSSAGVPLPASSAQPALQGAGEVDLMAARLGEMQAEVMRLNALGERLVQMSGLDPAEFDFESPPPQGGAETGPVRDYTIKELANELSGMVDLVQDRQRKLEVLEGVILDKKLSAKAFPAGWPVHSGYISSRYGFRIHPIRKTRIFHEGIDLASPRGTSIVAVADGVVTFSGRKGGYGRMIEIRHLDGMVTRYAHNSRNLVKKGQLVHQGEKIASVGSSGAATGPHVHFEVLKDGKNVDPMPYLKAGPRRFVAENTADQSG
ncbi:Peptidase M23 [Thiorhodococcus drewsii AZ1]|uniref:Peptidase M23 n=1 Tax=Thiorhodococcus drewsii AZ1 TaxID=765913 RepID=G2E014_9GAMM|nr:M23 family metallopeptidase [Thiorhodococcus drewsii]EGV32053.1 Peptidase M23 [Thiorhodococcus drewsii AZ1]